MINLLDKIEKTDVAESPFPHIVFDNPISDESCLEMIDQLPPLDAFLNGKKPRSNQRFSYPAARILRDPEVGEFWKNFAEYYTSRAFFEGVARLFEDSITHLFPQLIHNRQSLLELRTGIRGIDDFRSADILLDAQIGINTPVLKKAHPVRGVHIDAADKLFSGLFYLKQPEDKSTGGDLEIYCFKKNQARFKGYEISNSHVKKLKTITYRRNVLVLFVNSIASLHGVANRSLTEHPRYFINLIGQYREPLFPIDRYQKPAFSDKVRSLRQRLAV